MSTNHNHKETPVTLPAHDSRRHFREFSSLLNARRLANQRGAIPPSLESFQESATNLLFSLALDIQDTVPKPADPNPEAEIIDTASELRTAVRLISDLAQKLSKELENERFDPETVATLVSELRDALDSGTEKARILNQPKDNNPDNPAPLEKVHPRTLATITASALNTIPGINAANFPAANFHDALDHQATFAHALADRAADLLSRVPAVLDGRGAPVRASGAELLRRAQERG